MGWQAEKPENLDENELWRAPKTVSRGSALQCSVGNVGCGLEGRPSFLELPRPTFGGLNVFQLAWPVRRSL